jgi:hypothetical protein
MPYLPHWTSTLEETARNLVFPNPFHDTWHCIFPHAGESAALDAIVPPKVILDSRIMRSSLGRPLSREEYETICAHIQSLRTNPIHRDAGFSIWVTPTQIAVGPGSNPPQEGMQGDDIPGLHLAQTMAPRGERAQTVARAVSRANAGLGTTASGGRPTVGIAPPPSESTRVAVRNLCFFLTNAGEARLFQDIVAEIQATQSLVRYSSSSPFSHPCMIELYADNDPPTRAVVPGQVLTGEFLLWFLSINEIFQKVVLRALGNARSFELNAVSLAQEIQTLKQQLAARRADNLQLLKAKMDAETRATQAINLLREVARTTDTDFLRDLEAIIQRAAATILRLQGAPPAAELSPLEACPGQLSGAAQVQIVWQAFLDLVAKHQAARRFDLGGHAILL